MNKCPLICKDFEAIFYFLSYPHNIVVFGDDALAAVYGYTP